jgi:hypothetical protein
VSTSPLSSPVVLDGIVSDEKLSELLTLQAEYPELDYKSTLDVTTTEGAVELAKDIGAMQVRGGYIVIGVDDSGAETGLLDSADIRPFDEASLTQKMLRWLPRPLDLTSRVANRSGHRVVLIHVGRHPDGCAFFTADGQYTKNGRPSVVFREGEVFWRDGTRSARLSQQGLEDVVARRIADAKAGWLAEQREIRRHERADLETATSSRQLVEGPLGSVNLDMNPDELCAAALEFLRRGDTIGLVHLANDAVARARAYIDRGEVETELGALLDKLACLAATFLMYEQDEWFDRIIALLPQIYSMPLGQYDAQRFGLSTAISPTAVAPRVWLQIMERVYALGALAVRRRKWRAVHTLTVQHPERLSDFDRNWLRHALTMMSRAQHLQERRDDSTVQLSLLNLARHVVSTVGCLRPDGVTADDEAILDSLAQFDLLSNAVAIADAGDEASGRTFYPNFARLRQDRIQPVVDQLLRDDGMRDPLGLANDETLAQALSAIGDQAEREGWRSDGFRGWSHTPVAAFIADHGPPQTNS